MAAPAIDYDQVEDVPQRQGPAPATEAECGRALKILANQLNLSGAAQAGACVVGAPVEPALA